MRLKRKRKVVEPPLEVAYDAQQYFIDDVADPWRSVDVLERERLSQHSRLRELVTRSDVQELRTAIAELGPSAELLVNLAPGGANTLLYIAAEAGSTGCVSALLAGGADGRAHCATAYCPLYAACYRGHAQVATLLLAHFPHAVQQETVEKWLPLHAACIGGHPSIVKLLLEYPYPESVLNTYTDASGEWQYKFAFDVNARDVSGQTPLYVACTLANAAVVAALLACTVPCERAHAQQAGVSPSSAKETPSPARGGISLGIHALVNKLTGAHAEREPQKRICPVRVDVSRGEAPAAPLGSECARDSRRRSRSASAGAYKSPSPSPCREYNDGDAPWTALAVAARAKSAAIVKQLLSRGATDPHARALRECSRHDMHDLLTELLATRAYPDPDYKINKTGVSESVFTTRDTDNSLTYSALCPTTPVMVHWRELRCQWPSLRMSWLTEACVHVNPRLSRTAALHALTRLDVSNNELRVLPPELFSMLSLRYLNAAQNKLERLPTESEYVVEEGRRWRAKKPPPELYSAPVLQELYLQDNRLEQVPPSLFRLPALTSLDISNNKLRSLPAAVWRAPMLKDLNVALNHLRDLESECSSPASMPSSPAERPSALAFHSPSTQSKSSSRSPSIERSESESPEQNEDGIPVVGNRGGNAVWSSVRHAHQWRGVVEYAGDAPPPAAGSRLASLNLAHNQFTCVPPPLACTAPNLTSLNMAYNSLRSMSYVTSYPTTLRQLDLSHNEITCWPSLPQVESFGSTEGDPLACYCSRLDPNPVPSNGGGERERGAWRRPRSGTSVRAQLLAAACPARRHLRLEALRTLILANNLLTRIQLTTDDDGVATTLQDEEVDDDEDEWGSGTRYKSRLVFPQLSMLDVSCNLLRVVPPAIHHLSNLSVLNISGNKDITDLPPQMGLLSRLWNLNTGGCSLHEPLRSMVRGGRYRSSDIVGYLKSVLQEARPYARIKLMFVGLQGIGKTSLLECLRQESGLQHRRKPTEHWAKRMGNKSSRGNMSTVGVDIGTWLYEKHRSSRGPVTFRTWDFGGQQEYYATHQYFLSRRSLYLVVWKVTEGKHGLAGALDWLRSIQARAPGSPVIMVATHYDQVANVNLPENESPEALQRLIRSSIMGAPDADKLGLPRVLDSLEVSCSTRHNIRLLADIIYSVAFSVKPPGSKEPLLEQRVPATYLALEECVTQLAGELREPVLRHDEYKKLVTQYMQQKGHRMFRDAAELHQATMFLHENGVLLHYDDATLKELYFLRPQWLCDVLAHVVTVREINPFAGNGIMKVEDLAHVFKASPMLARGEEASQLGVSLLNKFELALCWDARVLLVPPLLAVLEPPAPQLPLRSRCWGAGTPRRTWPSALTAVDSRGTDSPTLIHESPGITLTARSGGALPLRRLLLMSYVPRGFWPRLCTRVLADAPLASAAPRLYVAPAELQLDESTSRQLEVNWGWKLWKTGIKLCCGALTLAELKETPPKVDALLGHDDSALSVRLRVRQEGSWCDLELSSTACVEIHLPAQVCVVRREDGLPIAGYQSLSLEPNPEVLAKVLAILSDHVDLLLEDWYPSLGTRFVHTSEGRCLITRVVPCPLCLRDGHDAPHQHQQQQLAQAMRRLELDAGGAEGDAEREREREGRRARVSQESRASDGDSGVGAESVASSRLGSVEGVIAEAAPAAAAHGWTVEECIMSACCGRRLACAHHPAVTLRDVAPDTLLLDVEESKRARWEQITRTRVAGRGAFGTVAAGTWRAQPVAVKLLQPAPPPPQHTMHAMHAYKAAQSRWEREPLAAACRAYCGLRQELGILSRLRHPRVLPLLAVCAAPLALLLPLAPQGALDAVLRTYRSVGARVGVRAARALALQLARALEYLHAARIVYRDLKSENVLVWAMPGPAEAAAAELSPAPVNVDVKLGDYGISRLAPPSGTKGFGGTEGFMAPEIMRYNGEEEYNEKVDCFSYGMLLYEIVSLKQPFEGHEAVKEAVLEGARPPLTPRDLQYGCCTVELMKRCWSGAPAQRPSAAALVAAACAPEYTALVDAAAARPARAAAATPVRSQPEEEGGAEAGWEVWCGETGRAHALHVTRAGLTHAHAMQLPPEPESNEPVTVTAMCRVGNKMWLGDSAGRVLVYSISSCALVWSVCVRDSVGGAASGVGALLHLHALQRVALALDCGRLFLVTAEKNQALAEGGFVLNELGAASELCCLAAVPAPHGVELWAGGDGLYTYSVGAAGALAASVLEAPARVTLLAHAHTEPYVLAYCEPGVHVYQWSVRTKEQTGKLDCSKLAPCSESLETIAIEHHGDNCQVTALVTLRGALYVGTARGVVIVADVATLRPVTVFRPYEQDVRAIIPLVGWRGNEGGSMLATLGEGYRPLLQRYTPSQSSNNGQQQYPGFYCLLWRADHWLPD